MIEIETKVVNNPPPPLKGRKRPPFSDEWLKHLSESHKGIRVSDETKIKIGNKNRGKKLSEETKRKIGASKIGKKRPPHVVSAIIKAHTGMKLSEESKKKMSESHKGRASPMKGKHHTLEAREKISKGNKGKERNEECKNKMREISKQRGFSEEARKKAILAHLGNKIWLGRKHTEKSKKKMSESQKKNIGNRGLLRKNSIKRMSKPQKRLLELIKKAYPTQIIESEHHIFIEGNRWFSLDVAIPELLFGFEYDEPYWHQDKDHDIERNGIIEALGWKIFHYESEKELDFLENYLNSLLPNIL